jgi:phosphoenolpyruvate carboxylase
MSNVTTCRSPAQINYDFYERIIKHNELFLKRIPGPDFYLTQRGLPSPVLWNQLPEVRAHVKTIIAQAYDALDQLTK